MLTPSVFANNRSTTSHKVPRFHSKARISQPESSILLSHVDFDSTVGIYADSSSTRGILSGKSLLRLRSSLGCSRMREVYTGRRWSSVSWTGLSRRALRLPLLWLQISLSLVAVILAAMLISHLGWVVKYIESNRWC